MAPRSKAILALILITPAPTVGVVLGLTLTGTPWAVLGWGFAKAWLFGLPVIWRLCVDRQPLSISPATRGGFGWGFVTGFVAIVGIVGGYALLGRHFIEADRLIETLEPLGLTRPSVYFAAAAYWVLINSVLEEYVFRWFIVSKCEAVMKRKAATIASALIFVVHHTVAMGTYFPWWINLVASIALFVAGATWSWLYIRYRSIWVPYVSHALADIGVFGVGAYLLFGLR